MFLKVLYNECITSHRRPTESLELTRLAIFVVETSGFSVNVLLVHFRKNPCFAGEFIQVRKFYKKNL